MIPETPDGFEPVWPSGIAGAQCDECYQFTVVRGVGSDFMGMRERYLCRACTEGFYDDELVGDDD